MSLKEFSQLKKIVEQAANAGTDGECAAFFRRATDIFRRHGYTWTQALDRVVTVMDMGDLEGGTPVDPGILRRESDA